MSLCTPVLAALFVSLAAVASADRAVLVGIDVYAKLPRARLNACERDVDLMQTVLVRNYGFKKGEVVVLKSAQAKHDAILAALDKAIGLIKPNERFLYYQSSHGRPGADGAGSLMTNTSDEDYKGDIRRDELQLRIDRARTKTKNVTVILDACYSGGSILAKGAVAIKGLGQAKVYVGPNKPQNSSENFLRDRLGDVVVPATQAPTTFSNTGKLVVNQYVSSRANEKSWTGEFPSGMNSVFTKFLTDQMVSKPASWADMIAAVNAKVSDWSKDQQHPVYMGPGGGSIFSLGAAPTSVTVDNGLLGLYDFDNVNRAFVKVGMKVGSEEFSSNTALKRKRTEPGVYDPKVPLSTVYAVAATDGFLFLLDRDQKDNVQLLVPMSLSGSDEDVVAGAAVEAGTRKEIANIQFDLAGPEKVKAILITDRAEAVKFVRRLRESGLLNGPVARTTMGKDVSVGIRLSSFYTADLRFDVRD